MRTNFRAAFLLFQNLKPLFQMSQKPSCLFPISRDTSSLLDGKSTRPEDSLGAVSGFALEGMRRILSSECANIRMMSVVVGKYSFIFLLFY
jgi:hypothetical protein